MSAVIDDGRTRQHRASMPGQSAWVAANAGTGKTRVLVERVIRLLLSGTRPDRILCLTFTKAAAAEMSERLFKILGEWTSLPDEALGVRLAEMDAPRADENMLADARRLFARAIETPGGLKIQTIHAFAQALLRRFPREADVAPHFAVMDDREARSLMAHARDEIFSQVQAGGTIAKAIGALSPFLNEEAIDSLLATIGAERTTLRQLLRRHGGLDAAIDALRQQLAIGAIDEADLDRELAEQMTDYACVIPALESGSPGDRKRAVIIQEFVKNPTDYSARARYVKLFFTNKGDACALSSLISKNCAKAHPEAAALIEAEQERLIDIEDRRKSVRIVVSSQAALGLGLAILDQYEIEKQRRARLDYDDLIDHTLALLSQADAAPWVLFKLDGGLEHVLVDEAQDTSPGQWAIVRALTQEFMGGEGANNVERTVFAVGDAKQSIYSFQGADPRGFERMRHYFGQHLSAARKPFETVDLILSFRSTREVLAVVDAVFAGPAGQGLGDEVTSVNHTAARQMIPGRVELWETIKPDPMPEPLPWSAPLDQTPDRSPKKLLAERIARKISQWLEPGGEMIVDDRHSAPVTRPVIPGDILILVRRRDQFVDEMIRALKQANIPVAGADRMRLDAQIAVMDLAAAARACLLPQDDLNLACLLKSPLIGFDDDDLFELAFDRGEQSLWARLCQSDRPRDITAHGLIRYWRDLAQTLTPFDFFARILTNGGRNRLLARLGPEANDPINELLAQALNFERMEVPTLEGFIHWLSSAEVEIKRDMDQSGNQVRVMTVHGAKGLEANIVFLPDTCTVPRDNKRKRLIELGTPDASDAPEAIGFAPKVDHEPKRLTAARVLAKLDEDKEQNRLLYVAMTRARNWLYIAGHEGRSAGGTRPLPPECWYSLTAPVIRDMGIEIVDDAGNKNWTVDFGVALGPTQSITQATAPEVILPEWIACAPVLEMRSSRVITPSRIDGRGQAIRTPFSSEGRANYRRGRLIHRLLQTLPDLDPALWADAAERYLDHAAKDMDISARRAIAQETLAVLNHQDFADVFGPGSRAEVAIAGSVSGLGSAFNLAGQVDRLCLSDSRVLIVDFKTNRPPPQTIEKVAGLYLRQMAAYRAALREIYPGRDVRTALLWTDGPRLMPLPDNLLDRAEAEIAEMVNQT